MTCRAGSMRISIAYVESAFEEWVGDDYRGDWVGGNLAITCGS